ncbi:4594_t:CDS:2 [Acaulospora morrowiae]|uniref:4594_t:CDS:1 n=1 Tax=Acaulospora morrowiae TaxID=94023 RepID=A0A9N8ZNG0_9GLOM|nr:4594_t:CDS:2 [Acaulospora morrowiae]
MVFPLLTGPALALSEATNSPENNKVITRQINSYFIFRTINIENEDNISKLYGISKIANPQKFKISKEASENWYDIASRLKYRPDDKILHRDLQTRNNLINRERNKVADLGLSKYKAENIRSYIHNLTVGFCEIEGLRSFFNPEYAILSGLTKHSLIMFYLDSCKNHKHGDIFCPELVYHKNVSGWSYVLSNSFKKDPFNDYNIFKHAIPKVSGYELQWHLSFADDWDIEDNLGNRCQRLYENIYARCHEKEEFPRCLTSADDGDIEGDFGNLYQGSYEVLYATYDDCLKYCYPHVIKITSDLEGLKLSYGGDTKDQNNFCDRSTQYLPLPESTFGLLDLTVIKEDYLSGYTEGTYSVSLGLISNRERLVKTGKDFNNVYSNINIRCVNQCRNPRINLITTTSKLLSYFLENNVVIEENVHEFLESVSLEIFSNINPTNFKCRKDDSFLAIHCEISIPLVEIRFEDIKPSIQLVQALENALLDMNPYVSLCKVFEKFGHLIPRKIIIGKKLSRNCHEFTLASYNRPLDQYKLSASSKKFDEFQAILDEWKTLLSVSGFDSTYFVSTEGNIVEIDHLETWILKDFHQLEIIGYSDLIPTNMILDSPMRKEIEKCFSSKLQVLMNGQVKITHDLHYRVEFDTPLQTNKYQIFGFITYGNMEIENSTVSFKNFSNHGFCVTLKSLNDEQLIGAMISWVMIGNPREIGFYSRNSRDIDLLQTGVLDVTKNDIHLSQKGEEYVVAKLPFSPETISKSRISLNSEYFISQYSKETNDILGVTEIFLSLLII